MNLKSIRISCSRCHRTVRTHTIHGATDFGKCLQLGRIHFGHFIRSRIAHCASCCGQTHACVYGGHNWNHRHHHLTGEGERGKEVSVNLREINSFGILTGYSWMWFSYWSPCVFAEIEFGQPIGNRIFQCNTWMIDIFRETCWRFFATNSFLIFCFQFYIGRNGCCTIISKIKFFDSNERNRIESRPLTVYSRIGTAFGPMSQGMDCYLIGVKFTIRIGEYATQ